MILALLLAAVEPATAIEAERAFARDAITEGNWTAFRKWSAPEAVVFGPQPINAKKALEGVEDPPVPIIWWPGRSYVSCDGLVAVNTGPWVRDQGKRVGFFTTVWVKKDNKWRWIYDGGGDTEELRAEGGDIRPRVASCDGKPTSKERLVAQVLDSHDEGLPADRPASPEASNGVSPDGTLSWSWIVSPKGTRHFIAQIWNGEDFETVVEDRVPAPAPPAQANAE